MNQHTDNISIITSESKVLRYIKEIIKLKRPLIISQNESTDESLKVFETPILKYDANSKQLILQQRLPDSWQEFVLSGQEAQIKCHHSSGTLTFSAQLSNFDNSDTGLYSQLSLPVKVTKKQSRINFRVSLVKHQAKVHVTLADDTVLFGNARDLSLGGGLCRLDTTITKETQNAEHFQPGSLLKLCRLQVFGFLDISCTAEISHLKELTDGKFQLGLKFIDLGTAQIIQIRQAISKIERKNINQA